MRTVVPEIVGWGKDHHHGLHDAAECSIPNPSASLDAWIAAGGGKALEAAAQWGRRRVIETIEASGLRGRGGAGFPTGTKWRTVAANRSTTLPSTVVVNGAEGEPGSFKDRLILRRNPYRVIEGALIAAGAIGADRVVIAVKASFEAEVARLRVAVDEIREAGWVDESIEMSVFEGPSEYLYGEETGAARGDRRTRAVPACRATVPPRGRRDRRGHVRGSRDRHGGAGRRRGCPTDAGQQRGDDGQRREDRVGRARLVPFRRDGRIAGDDRLHDHRDDAAPRCGRSRDGHSAVRGHRRDRRRPADGQIIAVMSGVSNPLLPVEGMGTRLSYEAMQDAGTGLGTGGFIVFDETVDLVAVAHGVSRFLATESCGQCTPCKQDGLRSGRDARPLATLRGHHRSMWIA